MTAKKRSFKSKGTDILKGKPQSMGEFLNDELAGQIKPDTHLHKKANPQLCKGVNTQKHISTNTHKDEVERFHLEIRTELADLIHEETRKRKKARNGKRPTKRGVIEDALEAYL